MITAFLHVVVDVVITCISATWSSAQICMTKMKHANNTAQRTLQVHTQTLFFFCMNDAVYVVLKDESG